MSSPDPSGRGPATKRATDAQFTKTVAHSTTKVTDDKTARQPLPFGKPSAHLHPINEQHLLVVEGSALVDILVDVEIATAIRAASATTNTTQH